MSPKSLISSSLLAVSVAALTLALPALGQPPSQPGPPANTGGLKFLAVVSASDEQGMSSDSQFVNLPGLNAVFSTTQAGCVVATVSAELGVQSRFSSPAHFRAVLDGSLMDGHGLTNQSLAFDNNLDDVYGSTGGVAYPLGYRENGGDGGVFSYTFPKCNVSRGSHTLVIEWAGSVRTFIRGRTLVVVGS